MAALTAGLVSACPDSQLGFSTWLLQEGRGKFGRPHGKKLCAGSVGECSGEGIAVVGGTDYTRVKNYGHRKEGLLDPVRLAARLVHPPAVQS